MGAFRSSACKLVLLVAAVGCCACSATTSNRLKARFAREQTCPADQVVVVEEGGMVYRASGCGKDTEYVCGSFLSPGNSNADCAVRGLNRREPQGNPPPRNDFKPDYTSPK